MNKRFLKRALAMLLLLAILTGSLGCKSKKEFDPKLEMDFTGRQYAFGFDGEASPELSLNNEGYEAVKEVIEAQIPEYKYSYLYELEEVRSRLSFDASVDKHTYNALNSKGVLDAVYLADIIEANNEKFMADDPFGYENVDKESITELCEVIIYVVNEMLEKYPDIDKERVYCNLGNLKILYDVGTLNYAQVSSEWVLGISKTNTRIVDGLKGENGFRNVLIHETMHIIQIGCECENIENCSRRCGISVYWDDFSMNTTDWGWFFEGSAERNMCNLTGEPAISYQYKMDYLCSYALSVMLRDEVKADTMETISFYSDPELLFDAFGAESEEERDELLKLMITTNVLQMQPASFLESYRKETGIDFNDEKNEELLDSFRYELKPDICISLSKEFYSNLIDYIKEKNICANDLFFLINLFEGHLNQHLNYNDESKSKINAPFYESYLAIRDTLFEAMSTESLDVEKMYSEYSIINTETNMLNAELPMFSEEKRLFCAERAEWQSSLDALGVKVG